MWSDFFLENTHFAVNIFAALVMSWIFWLYFDAWLKRKTLKEGLRMIGFLFLSFSFVAHSTLVESNILETPFQLSGWHNVLGDLLQSLGYVVLIISLLVDSLVTHPHDDAKKKAQSKAAPLVILGMATIVPGINIPVASFIKLLLPFLAVIVAVLYLRRATIGLEIQLKSLVAGFFLLSLSHLFSLASLLQNTGNIGIYKLVAPLGPMWKVEHVVLLFGVMVFARWIFAYLLKQLHSQLYMVFSVTILIVFLLTTITFSGLLLKNMQDSTLGQLKTDVKVLEFALNGKKSQVLSDSQVFAKDSDLISALQGDDNVLLAQLSQSFLLAKKLSFLVVTNGDGQVVARGEDVERVGDSLSDELIVKRALLGEELSTVTTKDGVLAPEVSIRAASPVVESEEVVGVVVLGINIDNAFVDGLKAATGLTTAIYGENKVSATTLVAEDGSSRRIGIVESNQQVISEVLGKGEAFADSLSLVNTPYFAAYLPLKDADENPVGMLFVGERQASVLVAAGRSIQLTFAASGILWLLAIVPSYMISKYIAQQLE